MNKQYYCTFFDHRYLDRGIALAGSLERQGEPYHLWILCMNQQTLDSLAQRVMANVTLVTLSDLEVFDTTLADARKNRNLVEFYFTSKSFLCLFILKNNPAVNLLTYLDADLFFFGRPSVIEDEMSGYSVGLTGHRFPPFLKGLEQFGMFNAGFISFRHDDAGLSCLTWWRDSCAEWCKDHVDNGRYADQRYLDYMSGKSPKVKIITHKGINLAPWNIAQYRVSWNGREVLVDSDPLVLYHFHGVKRLKGSQYDTGSYNYRTFLNKVVRNNIYMPYIEVLEKERGEGAAGSEVIARGRAKSEKLESLFPSLLNFYRNMMRSLKGMYYRSFISR